jgi:hypothetical protein
MEYHFQLLGKLLNSCPELVVLLKMFPLSERLS